jgi:transcriptional regulator with XRE-family HTH domain
MGGQGAVAVPVWTGWETGRLRAALRMSQREYAAHLGAAPRTVAGWEAKGDAAVISAELQAVLDTALDRAGSAIQDRFAMLLKGSRRGPRLPEGGMEPVGSGWIPGELIDSPEAFRPA